MLFKRRQEERESNTALGGRQSTRQDILKGYLLAVVTTIVDQNLHSCLLIIEFTFYLNFDVFAILLKTKLS